MELLSEAMSKVFSDWPIGKRLSFCVWRIGALCAVGGILLACPDVNADKSPVETRADSRAIEIFVSPAGDDTNPGTVDRPQRSVLSALRELRKRRQQQPQSEPIQASIWLRGGRYAVRQTVQLTQEDSGVAGQPLRISSYPGEQAVFDGRLEIDVTQFQKLDSDNERLRLPERARANVVVATIEDDVVAALLRRTDTQVSCSHRMLQRARFPNIGFALVDRVTQADTPQGKGTSSSPQGAKVRLSPAPTVDYANELSREHNARVVGYIGAAWLKESSPIHSVDAAGLIQLLNGTVYGFPRKGKIGRVFVENIIGELDEPGEWYFDLATRRLYLWPPAEINADTTIGIWAGPSVFEIRDAQFVSIERLTFENLGRGKRGDGAISIRRGNDNLVAGCTFRNIAMPLSAVNIVGGTNNGIRSCDFIDIENATRLYGGALGAGEIKHAGNYIENCHFTQVYSKSFYGKVCGIAGAGNVFRNNLAHNHNGQIVTIQGADHLIELNEIFNTGIEEGDGGSFYQGAMLFSWGNVYRHNFFHHIICIPQLYTRAAIFSDDCDMGDQVIGNVFYKAGECFKTNQGAGHIARDNLAIDSIHSFQVLHGRPASNYKMCMKFLDEDPRATTKDNYVGRAMAVIGKQGWQNRINSTNWIEQVSPFWLKRYPRMHQLFKQWHQTGEMTPTNTFENNYYFRFARKPLDLRLSTNKVGNNFEKSLSVFANPAALDFSFKQPKPAWAPQIPFERIGLYRDEFRKIVPDKPLYRRQVANRWQGIASAAGRKYDPQEVNRRSYYNTGLLLRGLTKGADLHSP